MEDKRFDNTNIDTARDINANTNITYITNNPPNVANAKNQNVHSTEESRPLGTTDQHHNDNEIEMENIVQRSTTLELPVQLPPPPPPS